MSNEELDDAIKKECELMDKIAQETAGHRMTSDFAVIAIYNKLTADMRDPLK